MTFPVTDADNNRVALLTGAELAAHLSAIATAVNALAPFLDGVEGGLAPLATAAGVAKLGSARRVFPIVKADANLAVVPDAIYVGGDGDLVVRGDDGVDATLAVLKGMALPIRAVQVRAATTATGLVGLVS